MLIVRFIAALVALLFAVPAGAETVRIGVLAFQGSERVVRDWEPTRAYLAASIPGFQFALLPFDLNGLEAAVAAGEVHFAITNPSHYVELETRHGATRMATIESERWGSPTAAVGSTVIARAARDDLSDLRDLRGDTLAVVSPDAFGGFQVIWRELKRLGLNPFADIRELRLTGFPMERVLWMVRDGAADAGILRACLLEELMAEGRVDAGEFKVVGRRTEAGYPCAVSSPLYPDWPIAKLTNTPHALAKRVAAALLSMPTVDGQSWTAPLDYTPVHTLMRELGVGPYSHMRRPSIEDMLRDNWQWLVAGVLGILWWIVHVARVEVLVRRRTAELEREIAEREKAQAEAERHREQRDQFSRLGILGEMASNIAHELNQPLAAIMNYARGMTRMLQSGKADPALLTEGAGSIAGQAERAAAIIQRIRGFVRRRRPLPEPVDLNEVVRETLGLFEGLAGRRGLAIHVHLAESLPRVSADRVEIQQVLLNLLQNAVDAMAARPDTRDGITVRTSAADGMVKVAVRDCGCGLAPGAEAHLFEPFFTTKAEGLGLGLSICRTIIESHGGHLWAAANDGPGLTVRFTLPATEDNA